MKKTSTYRLLLLVLVFLGYNTVVGQVVIPDSNFRQFLIDNYPSVMKPDLTLNPAIAANITGPFQCTNKGITDLTGIQYFTKISTLEIKNNPGLTWLPNIDALTNLTILGLDTNGLTSLPNVSTLTKLKIFSVKHNKLTSLPVLNSLVLLEYFLVEGNQLTSIQDISFMTNLIEMHLNDNPLTSIPPLTSLTNLAHLQCQRTNISAIPDLSNCTQLMFLIVTNNNVTTLPSLTACTLLEQVKVFSCKITSLPDLSGFPNLTSVKVDRNYLTFEDLIPLADDPLFSTYLLTPQYYGTAQSYGAFASAPFTIDLDMDDAIGTNRYSWFKDGDSITTTIENKYTFPSIQPSDAGVYTCKVRNISPAMSGIEIRTAPITITVAPCIVANTIFFSTPTTSCEYPISISIDENSFSGGAKPFQYVVSNAMDSSVFTTKDISTKQEGIYDITVLDVQGCKVKFPSSLTVSRPGDCDPVFYPNGDGIADTYFIEDTGIVKIYNRAGDVVKQLSTPAHWDGTNQSGKNLPSGLYVIEINSSQTRRITLLR